MSKFVLKRGLDIPVAGVPEQVITDEKNQGQLQFWVRIITV